jgi:transcriptional regulator with XRE-family HTH domain
MLAHTVGDLGAAVRQARTALGMTQEDLARRIGVSRRWVLRFERGNPRAEVQLVLDALAATGQEVILTPQADEQDDASEALDEVFGATDLRGDGTLSVGGSPERPLGGKPTTSHLAGSNLSNEETDVADG